MASLAAQGLVPGGHMLAPSTAHIVSITPCPSTNALARAFAAYDPQPAAAGSTAGEEDHHAHHATGGVDHAAMGHGPASGPASGLASGDDASDEAGDDSGAQGFTPQGQCAFSGGSLAAGVPEQPQPAAILLQGDGAEAPPLQSAIIPPLRHVRPPLRGPPLTL
ncbi:hypothetical protein [Erythrobacter sp. EC-HK427]|uniref:hypothetical protein n=1 Tax=Erythrobacter sp. EC-HK427 TaxID=2038396 RepID=UPI0018FE53CC|nr:hypothetical protein [Erythrobacter sp. EC-HK427]